MAIERLQKILSKAGFGSRRSCEGIIEASRVKINGETAKLGSKADPDEDHICVDDTPLVVLHKHIYIKIYKPRRVLSSLRSQGNKPIVRDLIPIQEYIYPVGRLDYDSEGLMILTDDGDLTLRLTHPRFQHEKEYHVLLTATPDEEVLQLWRNGVKLADGYITKPISVKIIKNNGSNTWLSVILKEGHKRQIREIGKATNLPVSRIIRTRIGPIAIGNLEPGMWRELSKQEISSLRKSVKLEY
jgi:23S rRNA pseudouridine2605 synthase